MKNRAQIIVTSVIVTVVVVIMAVAFILLAINKGDKTSAGGSLSSDIETSDEETEMITPEQTEDDGEISMPAEITDDEEADDTDTDDADTDSGDSDIHYGKWAPVDLFGRNIKFVSNIMSTDAPDENSNEYWWYTYENLMRVQHKYNCTIEKLDVSIFDTDELLITSVLAGEPFADFVYITGGTILTSLCARGFVLEYNDFVPPDGDVINDQDILINPAPIFGKNYIMQSGTGDYLSSLSANVLGINIDLIQQVGSADPRDLYEAGNWNWEKCRQVCNEVVCASRFDGEFYGLSGDHTTIVRNLVVANGGQIYNDTTGEYMLDSPNVLEALNFYMQLLLEDKSLYVMAYDMFGNQYFHMMGNVALFNLQAWQVYDGFGGSLLDFATGIVPYPSGPHYNGKSHFRPIEGTIIPKFTADPESVYKVFEEINAAWHDGAATYRDGFRKIYAPLFGSEQDYPPFDSGHDFDRLMKVGTEQYATDLFLSYRPWLFQPLLRDIYEIGSTPPQAVLENMDAIYGEIMENLGQGGY